MDTSEPIATSTHSLLRQAVALMRRTMDGCGWLQLMGVLATIVVSALISACIPLALKHFIDALTQLSAGMPCGALLWPAACYVGAVSALRVVGEVREYARGCTEQASRRRISEMLFDHVLGLPLRFHLDHRAGSLTETIEQGVRGYQLLLNEVFGTLLPVIIELSCVCVILLRSSLGQYSAVLLLALCGFLWSYLRSGVVIQTAADEVAATHVVSRSIYIEALHGAETVKYFCAEQSIAARYRVAATRAQSAWRAYFARQLSGGLFQGGVGLTCLAVTFAVASGDAMQGRLSVSDFVMLHAFVLRMLQPLESVGLALRQSSEALAYLANLLGLLRETREPEGSVPLRQASAAGVVEFDRVGFSYEQQGWALREVSFALAPGRVVGLAGESGAGKSALIRLIFRLYEPSCGVIRLDGVPLAHWPLFVVRHTISLVPQDVVLFHDTIAGNIAFATHASRAQILEAAQLACLQPLLDRLPQGIDTLIGERGLKLSGGERQRLAIARAIVRRRAVCILDEATASLDALTERTVVANICGAMRASALLLISHRLATLVSADEILFMRDGQICERGSHAELVAANGAYASMWFAQNGGQ